MGFLYIYPQDWSEQQYIDCGRTPHEVTIFTYRLPWIFHLFILLILATLLVIGSLSFDLLLKLAQEGNNLDRLLVSSVILFYFSCLLTLILAGWVRFAIKLSREKIQVGCRFQLFNWSKFLALKKLERNSLQSTLDAHLVVEHFMEGPNYARITAHQDLKAFQNRGHFLLLIKTDKKTLLLDRSSRKQDLLDLKQLLLTAETHLH